MTVPEFVKKAAREVHRVGSRETCDPPPSDTDEDWLILLKPTREVHRELTEEGWNLDGSFIIDAVNRCPVEERFRSYKLGDINLIVTKNYSFFQQFMAASSVAKRFNLLEKDDRIVLFQAVLYGNSCDHPMVLDTLGVSEEVEF